MSSKATPLSANRAAPIADMPVRSPAPIDTLAQLRPESATPEPPRSARPAKKPAVADTPGVPLNFKVPEDFQRAFKTYAASHGFKLNKLLQLSFEAYRKQQRD